MKKDKIIDIAVIIVTFFAILSIIINHELSDLDEIWNYNFARNVANGLIPYKDFNMVPMPLLSLVCGLILKVTFNDLIVMRCLAVILCSTIFFYIYCIFCKTKMKQYIAIILTFLIGILTKNYLCIDYNWGSLLITLIMIDLEIKENQKNKNIFHICVKSEIIIGLLAGMAFIMKQTSGILILIAALGNKLLFVTNKDDFQSYIKSMLYRLAGVAIPVSLTLIYLLYHRSISDFISYTIQGTKDFTNYIPYKSLVKSDIFGILAILVPITFIIEWYRYIIKSKLDEKFYLFVYGLAVFIIAFPISDKIHFIIGAVPTIIWIFIQIIDISEKLLQRFLSPKWNNFLETIFKIVALYFAVLCLVYATVNLYHYSKTNYSSFQHYHFIPISDVLEKRIEEIDTYILEKNNSIRILDASAALYMIPINQYHKNYDMFNKGNFGENGINKLIEEIRNSEDSYYMILKDQYSKNWQTPLEIIEFVKNNYNKVDEISIYDVYYVP